MDDVAQNTTSRQIKVCLVSLDAYILFNPSATGVQGGSEIDFYMISTELAKDKLFSVSVIVGDFGQQDIEIFDNVTVYKVPVCHDNFLSRAAALWKVMRTVNADIYFRQGAAITTDIVALFCRVNRKKFFLRTGTDYECNGSYIREHPLKARTYLWSVRNASRVFVQKTSDISKFLRTTGVNPIAIPNGQLITDSQSGEQKRDYILWVGRSDELKQPRLFIDLAKEVPSQQFVMICQQATGDRTYSELVRLAAGVNNLKFIESVPFYQIDIYFQRAWAFVNTSRAEGFPNAFVQAAKASTPIVSLNVNPDGFLDKYNCGICCRGNWDRLVSLIRSLPEQFSRFIEMGKNAGKYARDNHDITKIIEIYKKHFIVALSENRACRENGK